MFPPPCTKASASSAAQGDVRWENVLDASPGVTCSSISALSASAVAASTALAGCGPSSSSEMGGASGVGVVNSGHWGGVMASIDGGVTWAMVADADDAQGKAILEGYYVTAVSHPEAQTVLVAARASLKDNSDGGVWKCTVKGLARGGSTAPSASCERTLAQPVFDLKSLYGGSNVFVAALATGLRGAAVSRDWGSTWTVDAGTGLKWGGKQPFYTTLAVSEGTVILGALTVDPSDPTQTSSILAYRSLDSDASESWAPIDQPEPMDGDAMPKDRMALLIAPDDTEGETLYVAGNAEHVAWRVTDWRAHAKWTSLLGEDTADGAEPHCDCRSFAWEASSGTLLMTSDGGVFARSSPAQRGGVWSSFVGDIAAIELLSVRYDARDGSWVAGAQDNCVLLGSDAPQPGRALCVEFGDGTLTDIDRRASPARMFGSTQFLGQVEDADAPHLRRGRLGDGDDVFSFGFFQNGTGVAIDLDASFTEEAFPFFVSPYAVSTANPERLFFWAAPTTRTAGGFYEVSVPYKGDVQIKGILQSTPGDSEVWTMTANDQHDEAKIVAANGTHLVTASAGSLVASPLPTRYARPVTLTYDDLGKQILGPVSHAATMALGVSPADSQCAVVGGWPRVDANAGLEEVHLTADGGKTWANLTDGLLDAVAPSERVRISGLALVPLGWPGGHAVVVGSSVGVIATLTDAVGRRNAQPKWTRVGSLADFPLVLASGLDYDRNTDTLAAATMGRGAWVLEYASMILGGILLEGNAAVAASV